METRQSVQLDNLQSTEPVSKVQFAALFPVDANEAPSWFVFESLKDASFCFAFVHDFRLGHRANRITASSPSNTMLWSVRIFPADHHVILQEHAVGKAILACCGVFPSLFDFGFENVLIDIEGLTP